MSRILESSRPLDVFSYFEDICAIPHGSGNTREISDYCVRFAEKNSLWYNQDELNNIIIKKPASKGYEGCPAVILQGHLDMVCEKDEGSDIDFLKDGLRLKTEDDFVFADGTTLGGDDGIAVAMILSILADKQLPHPPIEALFTVDEETGMFGADGFDASLLSGKMLINIDSENEGVLTVSCAGGARAEIEIPLQRESESLECFKITLDGLIGGHSGVEINKGRLNSNIALGRFLKQFDDIRIADIKGGLKDNAIPVLSECIVSTNENIEAKIESFLKGNRIPTDSGLNLTVKRVENESCFSAEASQRIIKFLNAVPNGVQAMSRDIEGLVETSLNLGILFVDNDCLKASFAVRSSVGTEKQRLIKELEEFALSLGGKCSSYGHYPAWEYRKQSPLREKMVEVFARIYGKKPIIEAIHAGLECGIISEKISGLDAVSIGPDLFEIHTPRERLSISSTERTYKYICEILKELRK